MKSGKAAIYIRIYCIISGLKAPHHPTRTKYEVPHFNHSEVEPDLNTKRLMANLKV